MLEVDTLWPSVILSEAFSTQKRRQETDYFVAALAFLFIPLWFGSMVYLFIKDEETEGVQRQESSREQGQQGQRPIKRKRGN